MNPLHFSDSQFTRYKARQYAVAYARREGDEELAQRIELVIADEQSVDGHPVDGNPLVELGFFFNAPPSPQGVEFLAEWDTLEAAERSTRLHKEDY